MNDPRRRIPATDAVLNQPEIAAAQRTLGHSLVKSVITRSQQRARAGEIAPEEVAADAAASLPPRPASTRAVLNATGVLVHTNLGRAPLSAAAVEAVTTAAGTTDVEFDLPTGARARRGEQALAALAEAIPAAGAVHVVNNNAAALLLCANTLAAGKEIVISRGELVEIGDGFRIPDLLTATGARLREVGTTNRTRAGDYERALGPETRFVLKVHPSNFRVDGFTAEASVAELAALGLAERGIPLVADLGSGLLGPHPLLPDEPDAQTTLAAGADLVTASGDKLLGGPQAGLLAGDEALVTRLRRAPEARALRVDKLTLAALEATLRGPAPPVAQALDAEPAGLLARADALAAALLAQGIDARVVESAATVGGGGAPGVCLPSAAVSLPERYAAVLRAGSPPVVGRIEAGRCLLDLRGIADTDDEELRAAVARCT